MGVGDSPQLPAPYGEFSVAQNVGFFARHEFQVMRFIPLATVPQVFPAPGAALPPKDAALMMALAFLTVRRT
jgi:hypothetical protein